jgi:hypothetical protein
MSFEITPRKRRDGFTLDSQFLLFPLWYTTLHGALSYARFLGRERGCDIRIRNASGSVIDEVNVEGNFPANRPNRKKI